MFKFIARKALGNSITLYNLDGEVVASFTSAEAFEAVFGKTIEQFNNATLAANTPVLDSAGLARANID